jgi:hypothetical protein
METYLPTEEKFCVAAISDNTNSFGLRGMVLVSERVAGSNFCASFAGKFVVVMRLWRCKD